MITCVRNHATAGEHRVTCPDHPGWDEQLRPNACHGCLPRAAEVGFLCAACYDRVIEAIVRWPQFAAYVRAAEGRLVSPEVGGGASPRGYSNLSLSFLELDACDRLLASRGARTVDLWVHDEHGAHDAITFAFAAEQAFAHLEVKEREQVIVRERCEHCGTLAVATTHPERGATVVTCSFCGTERARIRPDMARWTREATCAELLHADCEALDCRCSCHLMGAQSRPSGVAALWDADQHTVAARRRYGQRIHSWKEPRGADGWALRQTRGDIRTFNDTYRADWIVQDALTVHHITERKAA